MFGHLPELIIILVIGLIVFGPEKLPEVAAEAGKMVREFRQIVDTAMNPHDTPVPDDFSTYYYESLGRSGEDVPSEEGEGKVDVDMLNHLDEASGGPAKIEEREEST